MLRSNRMNVAYRGHAARVLSTVEGKSDTIVSARWAVGVCRSNRPTFVSQSSSRILLLFARESVIGLMKRASLKEFKHKNTFKKSNFITHTPSSILILSMISGNSIRDKRSIGSWRFGAFCNLWNSIRNLVTETGYNTLTDLITDIQSLSSVMTILAVGNFRWNWGINLELYQCSRQAEWKCAKHSTLFSRRSLIMFDGCAIFVYNIWIIKAVNIECKPLGTHYRHGGYIRQISGCSYQWS